MGWGNTELGWLAKLAGAVALIEFGMTVVAVVGFYALGVGSLDVPVLGTAVLFVPPAVTAVAFLTWAASRIALRYLVDDRRSRSAGTRRAGAGRRAATGSNADHGGRSEPEAVAETAAESSDRLREFNRANTYLTAILGFFLVVSVVSAPLTAAASGTPLGIVVGFFDFATTALGGTTTLLVTTAWFAIAWYGIRTYRTTEAWLAGIVGWTLFTLSGLSLLTTSLGAIAIVIGGVQVLRVGLRARGGTEVVFLDEYVESVRNDARTGVVGGAGGGEAVGGEVADGEAVGGEVADGEAVGGEVADGEAVGGEVAGRQPGHPGSDVTDGRMSMAEIRDRFQDAEIETPGDVRDLLAVAPVFVHPREAGHERLTYLSYLSYALGGLLVLSSLLVGVQLWGFPALGVWGIVAGAVYLGHGFGLPQRSPVVHAAGTVWYVLGLLVALVTVSPVAIAATAVGTYLAWTATAGIPQPETVVAAAQGPSAADDRSDGSFPEGLIGGGIVAGIVLGIVLDLLGAAVFAWVSVQTETVYGLLVILPAIAAGFGVAVGTGERGGLPSGLVAAGLAVVSIGVGFRLLNWWMPPSTSSSPRRFWRSSRSSGSISPIVLGRAPPSRRDRMAVRIGAVR
ncbi:hypothetical protein SAMN05192561_11058 [Halopenitus malekzadehii]|uniref:Uncharacterized protein n=1 Tax=Halopenitus malekzadehii TaxID=1267564 RepID=A0A1H6JBC1_9EURY|nr:hypothetical protein [Halopenitus malekzadehii]SEH59437.1 hypothetical protein SAMN05192561_11058 [Halopenitus malekzadehii]